MGISYFWANGHMMFEEEEEEEDSSEELLQTLNTCMYYIFPPNPGLTKCLVPYVGPADVYTLSKHASINRATS